MDADLKSYYIGPGDRVLYVPSHAQGDTSHPDCEAGTVTGTNHTYIFVRFDGDTGSQACNINQLRALSSTFRKKPQDAQPAP